MTFFTTLALLAALAVAVACAPFLYRTEFGDAEHEDRALRDFCAHIGSEPEHCDAIRAHVLGMRFGAAVEEVSEEVHFWPPIHELTLGSVVLTQLQPAQLDDIVLVDEEHGTASVTCAGFIRCDAGLLPASIKLCYEVDGEGAMCSDVALPEHQSFDFNFTLDGFQPGTHTVAIGLTVGAEEAWNPPSLLEMLPAELEMLPPERSSRLVAILSDFSLGGQEVLVLRQLQLLHGWLGHDLHFVCYADADTGPLRADVVKTGVKVHLLSGLVPDRSALNSLLTEELDVLRDAASATDLPAALRSLVPFFSQFDVVSLPNSREPKMFSALHLARIAGVRTVVLELPNLSPPPALAALATVLVSPSAYVCKHPSVATLRSRCLVVPPVAIEGGRSLRRANSDDAAEGNSVTFAYAGRISAELSPGLFVRAAAKVASTPPEAGAGAKFIMLGGGAETLVAPLRRLAENISLTFAGFVDGPDAMKEALETRVDAVVNPRLFETFGIATVEAMSVGVPPILCRHDAAEEVVTHGVDGLLVECRGAGAPEALAAAMRSVLVDRDLLGSLGERARLSAHEKFSAAKFRENYVLAWKQADASEYL